MVKPRQLSEMKVTATSRGAGGFVRYCSSCHGVEGRGDGLNAFNIKTSPRDFTDTAAMRSKSVSSIQHVIQTGGAVNGLSRDMPPWGKTLDSSSITDLGEYVWGLVIGSSASTTKE
jgi:mono/diheme cytochrome c family protein